MRTLDSAEEQELLDAVKEAVSLVDDHDHDPSDAVAKVANDLHFGPGKIRMVCHAYNTGRQTMQREHGKTALDKLADFPLADPDKAIAKVYRPEAKVAVDSAYNEPPDELLRGVLPDRRAREKMVKAAADSLAAAHIEPPISADLAYRRGLAKIDKMKQAREKLAMEACSAESNLHIKVARLVNYFKQFPRERLPFALVEKAAATYLGPTTKGLLDLIYAQSRCSDKRAAADDMIFDQPVPLNREPLRWVVECVDLAKQTNELRVKRAEAEKTVARTEEEFLRPFVQPSVKTAEESPYLSLPCDEKTAGILSTPAVGASIGTYLTRSIGSAPSRDDLVRDEVYELEDPQHLSELRKIRTQAMLNRMLTDPDDPISGHDPEHVTELFNEVSQMAPRLSEQPAAIRPILQRRLMGHVQPFEAKEIADIEKSLGQTKSMPESILSENRLI